MNLTLGHFHPRRREGQPVGSEDRLVEPGQVAHLAGRERRDGAAVLQLGLEAIV